MRLALTLMPLPTFAGANPEALYRLVTGDGGETCGFDRPFTDGGIDVVLDLLCRVPAETMQASTRRIGLDLESPSPGLRDPADRLTVTDKGQTLTLVRCK